MTHKNILNTLGFLPKNKTSGIFFKKYPDAKNYVIEVNIESNLVDYGKDVVCENKTSSNLNTPENWVVLECVDRLLLKGYEPKNIILEKTWPSGHGTSGRLDICVLSEDGSEHLLIECKTYGKEFDKELTRMKKDGGQLFTYFKFSNKANLLMLYASKLQDNSIVYRNEVVKIEDEYRNGDVKDFYERWSKLTKNNGVFDAWVSPYDFESKALTMADLVDIKQEDSGFIFNRFLEILRHNTVSDKGNAFNRIFTLFLSKIYDEKINEGTNNQLGFQWLEGVDDHRSFQLRLTDLYKNGMYEFLEKNVTDFSETEFNDRFHEVGESERNDILALIQKIRLEKNNEFAIKDVFDESSFEDNAVVVKEIVELLQGYKLRYARKQQYLSDFFELLLTTGLKQESGQFFTPVPVAQFVIKSLPMDTILSNKLKSAKIDNNTLLPYVMDYAAGSGHFLTETMHEFQRLIDQQNVDQYPANIAKKIRQWKDDHFVWALQYIYGIEKDYRLVKVGKVGCYLHGDGLANVIHSDGLAQFGHKDYKGKLLLQDKDFPKENKQFDIIVSNPPYSVSSFRGVARRYYSEVDFELYEHLTDNSSEIECLFIERTKQLLKDGGVAGIILPSSILNNGGIYAKARAMMLEYFDVLGVAELGSNTFMATGTNTATFFLRRKNNYVIEKIRAAVQAFFSNHQDVTVNGIENPFGKYISRVWVGLNFDDYISLIIESPNEVVRSHDLYKEYCSQMMRKKGLGAERVDKAFWQNVLELEAEKLVYFILTLTQQVVIVNSGEKETEKRFLGYGFSNRRGDEGIHPYGTGNSIEDCTQLFDAHSFVNPTKASTYIYQAFQGNFSEPIDPIMQNHVSRTNLVDMLNFSRPSFDKSLSTSVKKKVNFPSKYRWVKLGDVCDVLIGGTPSRRNNEYFGGENLWVSIAEMNGDVIFNTKEKITDLGVKNSNVKFIPKGTTLLSFKLSIGKTALAGNNLYTNEAIAGLIPKDPNLVSNQYIFQLFNTKYISLERDGFNAFGKSLNSAHLKSEIKIPIPSPDEQSKIVSECKAIDISINLARENITELKMQMEALITGGKLKRHKFLNVVEKISTIIEPSEHTGSVNYIGLENIESASGRLIGNVVAEYSEIKSSKIGFLAGDVLYGKLRPNLNKVYLAQFDGVCSTDILVFRFKRQALAKFYANYLRSGEFLRAVLTTVSGQQLPRTSWGAVKEIEVPILSPEDEKVIVGKIEDIDIKMASLQKIIDQAPAIKVDILKKYL